MRRKCHNTPLPFHTFLILNFSTCHPLPRAPPRRTVWATRIIYTQNPYPFYVFAFTNITQATNFIFRSLFDVGGKWG